MLRNQEQSAAAGKWQAHAKALARSGLSRAEYCRQHNLSYHALAYWERKLRCSEPPPLLVELPKVEPAYSMSVKHKFSGVSLRLSDRISIELEEQFSPTTLNKVLALLEDR